MLVSDDLHFKMSRRFQILFNEDHWISKSSSGFLPCLFNTKSQTILVVCDTHSASATTACSLDNHWIANFACDFHCFVNVFNPAFCSRKDRRASLLCKSLAVDLIAKQRHRLWTWSDEFETAVATDFSEVRILGKESIARMDGICLRNLCRSNDAFDSKIGIFAWSWADTN